MLRDYGDVWLGNGMSLASHSRGSARQDRGSAGRRCLHATCSPQLPETDGKKEADRSQAEEESMNMWSSWLEYIVIKVMMIRQLVW